MVELLHIRLTEVSQMVISNIRIHIHVISNDMYMNTNCDLLFLASVLTTALDFKTYNKSFILVFNIVRSVMNTKLMNYYKCLLHP